MGTFSRLLQIFVLFTCGGSVFTAHPTNKTGQSNQTPPRTRLLVIRPPPGTGQPNRVLIITDPRKSPSDPDTFRREPSRTRASDPFLTAFNKPDEPKPKVHQHGARNPDVGGHPQSAVRRRNMGLGRGPSLRGLLDDLRNSRPRNSPTGSNIARISETIPRAAPPVVPTDSRFGDLNMPSGIEAALKKLRKQAMQLGRMRDQIKSGNIQIPDRNPVMNRNILELLRQSLAGNPPSQNGGQNIGSGRFTGNVGVLGSPRDKTVRNERPNIGSNLRTRAPAVATNSASTSSGAKIAENKSNSVKTSKKRVINSDTAVITNNGVVSPLASSQLAETTNVVAQTVNSGKTADANNANIVVPSGNGQVASSKKPSKGSMNLNASSEVKAQAAKAESNVTETKSLKTKNIKVTTVIKGGTAADVAAAAASQAEIANAVAQGKEINSSSLAAIAAKASAPKATAPPVGSITVKREPNGVSIITLSDGQGEPVVLRASGPVKIERIIKPNGKVQFLINPVNPKRPPVDFEFEAEDITTTQANYNSIIFGGDQTTSASTSITPDFMPSMSVENIFDPTSTTTSGSAAEFTKNVLTDILEPQTAHDPKPIVKSGILADNAVLPINQNSAIKPQVENIKTNILEKTMPLSVNNDLGAGQMAKIPRPPKLSDSKFGPFDMLNSVIDFNKRIPRPSDASIVGNLPTTLKPTALNAQSVLKKTVLSTDAMPQYTLASSPPPKK